MKKILYTIFISFCLLGSTSAIAGTGWGATPFILTAKAPHATNPFLYVCGYTKFQTFNNQLTGGVIAYHVTYENILSGCPAQLSW